MSNYEISAYVFSVIIALLGILWLWISYKSSPAEKSGIGMFLNPKLYFMLLAVLYLSVAHFGIYTGLAYSIEYGSVPPCENVVANSTQIGTDVFVYQYKSSCAAADLGANNAMLNVFTWIIYILILSLALGSMLLLGRWLSKW